MRFPTGLVQQRELLAGIEQAKAKLGPEVAHVAYRLRDDSTDEPSIFFRITLHDWATGESGLYELTDRVRTTLLDEIRPIEDWGLRAYFNFRSYAEQQQHPSRDWV